MAALCYAPSLAHTMSGLQGMRRSCLVGPGCCAWAATSPAAQCCTGALAQTARASSAQVAASYPASRRTNTQLQAPVCFPDS